MRLLSRSNCKPDFQLRTSRLCTFRDQVKAHYESVALVGFSLDVLMNSNIEEPLSQWDEMFLPLKLRERLYLVESDVAEDGVRNKLLSDPQEVMLFAHQRWRQTPIR